MTKPRALFFGTPDFAVPVLEALHGRADVVRVFAQPDRPVGRGLALAAPPVKERALALGLVVEQPTKIKPPEFAASLRALEADIAIVVAYGRILPKAVLEAPRLGCLNLHASLLPRHRGAAPIQWAVLEGDRETGICLMQMDDGLDTGPVLAKVTTAIDPDETSGELFARLAPLAAELLVSSLDAVLAGALVPTPQEGEVTHARMLEKRDGLLDLGGSATRLHDRVRGLQPWPTAECRVRGLRLRVHRTVRDERATEGAAPGTILAIARDEGVVIATGEGALRLVELQLEGKKRMAAFDVANGLRLAVGDVLGGGEG